MVPGANIEATALPPSLLACQKSFAVSIPFKVFIIVLPELAILPTVVALPTASASLAALRVVLPATSGVAPPNVPTSKAANATSSKAIELIIPTVYPEFNKRLLVQAIPPSLLELPIAIASSNSFADFKSTTLDPPVTMSPIAL